VSSRGAGCVVGVLAALSIAEPRGDACTLADPPPPKLLYPRHGEVDVAVNTRIWITANEEIPFRVISPNRIEKPIAIVERFGSTFVLTLREPLPAESTFIVQTQGYRDDTEIGRFTTGSRRDERPPKFAGITGLLAERQTVIEWNVTKPWECGRQVANHPVGTVFDTSSVTFGEASDDRSPNEAIFFFVELSTAEGARRQTVPLGPRGSGD
jgi:hypothetical protein